MYCIKMSYRFAAAEAVVITGVSGGSVLFVDSGGGLHGRSVALIVCFLSDFDALILIGNGQ